MRAEQQFSRKAAVAASRYTIERDYWLDKLSGEIVKSTFPYDHPKKNTHRGKSATLEFKITGRLFSTLIKVSNKVDYTLHMILVAGLVAVLGKYTNNSDIIIGVPIYRQETEGEFVNTVLALRHHLHDNLTFKELLMQVKQTVVEANQYQNYPLETLAYQLKLSFSETSFPLFDIAILLKNIHDRKYLRDYPLDAVFSFSRLEGYIDAEIEYDSLLYEGETIERIVNHFLRLLERSFSHVDQPLVFIDMIDEKEMKKLLFDFNRTVSTSPGSKSVNELFEKQAEKTPDKVALTGNVNKHGEVMQLTYRELYQSASRTACLLQEKGIQPGTIAYVVMERSIDMIIGILGILQGGGAYLPVDPSYPPERIRFMLKDSGARILMSESSEKIEDIKPRPLKDRSPMHLCYVIYTSGTSGRSRGVLIYHQGVVNMVGFHCQVFGVNHNSRVSQVVSPAFDAMAFEIWPCLLSGAALYIADNETRLDPAKMKYWIIQQCITHSFQSTVMAEHLLDEPWPSQGVALRSLPAAGDRLTRYPDHPYPFTLYNLYGPTEDTIWTTWTRVEVKPDPGGFPTIGRPVANHQVYIMSPELSLQPVGVPGELCIGGVGLAPGYLNRPELTAEKFVEFSLGRSDPTLPTRIYRSGDLARWLPDGEIEFLGRVDHQVKIRGFRIELGEVEFWLLKHESINKAVVIERENKDGVKYLCGYINSAGDVPLNTQELKEHLSRTLPDFMIPDYFVPMDKIPLTPNGKVDRRALPEPQGIRPRLNAVYEAPSTRLEKTIADIWKRTLNLDRVGIHDNFYDLGGNSLRILQAQNNLKNVLGKDIPVAKMFEYPTIHLFAQYLSGEERKRETDIDEGNIDEETEITVACEPEPTRLARRRQLLEEEENE